MNQDTERRRLAAMLEESAEDSWRGMAVAAFLAVVLAGAIATLVLHFGGVW